MINNKPSRLMQEEQADQWNDAEAWVQHLAEQKDETDPSMAPQHPDYMRNDFEQEQRDYSQHDPH